MRGSGLEGFLWLSTASFAMERHKHYSRRYARLGQAAGVIRGGCQIGDREKADFVYMLHPVRLRSEGPLRGAWGPRSHRPEKLKKSPPTNRGDLASYLTIWTVERVILLLT